MVLVSSLFRVRIKKITVRALVVGVIFFLLSLKAYIFRHRFMFLLLRHLLVYISLACTLYIETCVADRFYRLVIVCLVDSCEYYYAFFLV